MDHSYENKYENLPRYLLAKKEKNHLFKKDNNGLVSDRGKHFKHS
jgi:hypothetical protein